MWGFVTCPWVDTLIRTISRTLSCLSLLLHVSPSCPPRRQDCACFYRAAVHRALRSPRREGREVGGETLSGCLRAASPGGSSAPGFAVVPWDVMWGVLCRSCLGTRGGENSKTASGLLEDFEQGASSYAVSASLLSLRRTHRRLCRRGDLAAAMWWASRKHKGGQTWGLQKSTMT